MDKDVKEIIEKIAEKLGTTSEFLYEKLVKQAKINAVTGVIQLVFALLVGVGLAIYVTWQVKIGIANYNEIDKYMGIYIGLGIIDAIFVFAYVFTMFDRIYFLIDECIKCWKNPEGWAIDELLDKFS